MKSLIVFAEEPEFGLPRHYYQQKLYHFILIRIAEQFQDTNLILNLRVAEKS